MAAVLSPDGEAARSSLLEGEVASEPAVRFIVAGARPGAVVDGPAAFSGAVGEVGSVVFAMALPSVGSGVAVGEAGLASMSRSGAAGPGARVRSASVGRAVVASRAAGVTLAGVVIPSGGVTVSRGGTVPAGPVSGVAMDCLSGGVPGIGVPLGALDMPLDFAGWSLPAAARSPGRVAACSAAPGASSRASIPATSTWPSRLTGLCRECAGLAA